MERIQAVLWMKLIFSPLLLSCSSLVLCAEAVGQAADQCRGGAGWSGCVQARRLCLQLRPRLGQGRTYQDLSSWAATSGGAVQPTSPHTTLPFPRTSQHPKPGRLELCVGGGGEMDKGVEFCGGNGGQNMPSEQSMLTAAFI